MIKLPPLPTLLSSASAFWRNVPRFWGVSVVLGLLLAAAFAPAMAISLPVALAPGLAAAGLAGGLLAAALVWRARLWARRYDNTARTAIYRAHGRRFFLWFAGLSLVMVAVAWLTAPLALRLFGQTPLVLALGAAGLACAVYCLRGISLRPSRALGICWLVPLPDDLPGYWARSDAALILSRRYDVAIAQDEQQPRPRFRGLALAFDPDIGRLNEEMPTDWELSPPARLALRELARRALALTVPFGVTLALGWVVFAIVQQPLAALTLRAREMTAQIVVQQAAQENPTNPKGGTPDPRSSPEGGGGTPDPQSSPEGGGGTPDPRSSPEGGGGTPDPRSSPEGGGGTPDPQISPGPGPGPATEGAPIPGSTPPQTQAPGRIPVPQGGGRRIELEIPSLQAVGESATAANRNAAELANYRLPASFRPPPTQPVPARASRRAVQYVPNWILAVTQR